MTNRMKVIFVIVSAVSALFIIILSTPFAIDTGGKMFSALAGMLDLQEEPALFCSGGIGNSQPVSLPCFQAEKALIT